MFCVLILISYSLSLFLPFKIHEITHFHDADCAKPSNVCCCCSHRKAQHFTFSLFSVRLTMLEHAKLSERFIGPIKRQTSSRHETQSAVRSEGKEKIFRIILIMLPFLILPLRDESDVDYIINTMTSAQHDEV